GRRRRWKLPAHPRAWRWKPTATASATTAATCPSSPCACSTRRGARSATRTTACASTSKARPNWSPPTTATSATSPPSPRPSATSTAAWRWRSCAGLPANLAPPPCTPPPMDCSQHRCRSGSARNSEAFRATTIPQRLRPSAGSIHATYRGVPMKRHTLATVAAVLLAASAPAIDAASPAPTLKAAYTDASLIGTAVNDRMVSGEDARAQALAVRHFNAITAENVMKAEVLHPEPDTWDFAAADAFVAFGQKHDMYLIGHTLVWHNQTPAWFFQDGDGGQAATATMRERMREYIGVVAGRYSGKVQAWDVVNEVVGEDGQYRDTLWTRAYGGDGDALVRDAFRFAAAAAPDAQLYYNDFNAWRPEKRDGIVRMVKMLQAAGIRID